MDPAVARGEKAKSGDKFMEDIRIGQTLQVVSRRDRSSDQLSSLCSLMTWKMVCRIQY